MKYSVLVVALFACGVSAQTIENVFAKGSYEGALRVGYQAHHQQQTKSDIAIGGKLKYQSATWHGLVGAVAFYTTQGVGQHNNIGVPFYDNDNHNYTLLGEAYLEGYFGNTTLTLGRQILDTPFINSDDVGMIPNLFEAYTLVNTEIRDTTLLFSHVSKWAGVDTPDPAHFRGLNGKEGVQTVGIVYEGIAHTHLSSWYYRLKDVADIGYLEASYEKTTLLGSFRVATQYSFQDYRGSDKAEIVGLMGETGFKKSGIGFGMAYNKTNSQGTGVAENFFGGGPFFSSGEYLTLAEAGINGDAFLGFISYDLTKVGIKGRVMLSKLHLKGDSAFKADEIDLVINYDVSKNLMFDLIYSDVDHQESFQNLRAFANYRF